MPDSKPLGSILPGGEQIVGDDSSPAPDALGAWAKSLSDAPAKNATSASTVHDDALGSWAKSLPDTPVKTVPAVAAIPAVPPANETLPQAINRWTAEAHGHGTPSITGLITGERPDSWGDEFTRLGAGVLRGGGDVADTLAQGITKVGTGGASFLAKHGLISPESAAAMQDWRETVNKGIAQDQQGFDAAAAGSDLSTLGRLGGNVIASAPLLEGAGGALAGLLRGTPAAAAMAAHPIVASAIRGAAAGAGTNLLTSSTSDQPLSEQMTSGGIAGAVLGPLGYGAGRLGARLLGGGVDHETAQLARTARDNYGIPITAGQISANPTVRTLDSVLQRLPFTGYGERTAAQQGAFNRAISNTWGDNTPKITPQTIQAAKDRVGQVFDDVATRTGNIAVDVPFMRRLGNIVTDARSVLPASEVAPIENQLRNIVSTVDPATRSFSAETYQALTRKGAPLDRAMQSKDPNIRYYASQVRDALDDVMQRSAPADVVQDLVEARAQWKAIKTVEPLAKKATTGDISPPLLLGAVNKSYTRAGGALGELGRIGQRFIKEPPNSLTADRYMLMQHLPQLAIGATGLGSLGAATYFDPDSWQRNALLAAGAVGAGRLGSSALRSNLLTNAMIRSGMRNVAAPGAAHELLRLAFPAGGALTQRRDTVSALP